MHEIAKSPSQTSEWMECPIKRMLNYKMGLKPRRISKGEIAAIGGRAFAKGMETFYRSQISSGPVASYTDILQASLSEISLAKQHITDRGRDIPQWEQAYYASIEGRVENAIKKYLANDPITSNFTICDVEKVLPSHGNARIDLGVRDDFGLAVVDFKFKLRLDAKYYDREVLRYKNSWQQYHYSWAYEEDMCEPVRRYYICLVVAEPRFSVKLHEYPIHPETMEMWKQSAQRIWTQMEHEDQGLSQPWMAAEHETKYGPCPYQAACFTHRYDMNLMLKDDYVLDKEDS